MNAINYFDFDLLIERSTQNYTAHVLNSPAGQATSEFAWPFNESEDENFLYQIRQTKPNRREVDLRSIEMAKIFGGQLFDTVFKDDLRGCLQSSLNEAQHRQAGLRLRLHLADTLQLSNLPWEYLYNSGHHRFLALTKETPLVRYMKPARKFTPLAITPPLSILVVIANPTDDPTFDADQEWAKLYEAFGDLQREGLVRLERLERATLANLQRQLRQNPYHIFHFVGHGGFDQQRQEEILIMEDEAMRRRTVSGQELGTLLADTFTLRLAVLDVEAPDHCTPTAPFAGVTQSLIEQGIPAVIAMQFEMADAADITFAQEFYGALVDGFPIDSALAEARKALYVQNNGVEWGAPVLYMRSPDGYLFDMASDDNRATTM